MSSTSTVKVSISNPLGLHARPAMTFVEKAMEFASEISVRRGDADASESVDGKSIMHMMMLAATMGTELVITASGSDAEVATTDLRALVESGFGEN